MQTLASSNGFARGMKRVKPYLFLLPMLVFAVGFVYYPFFKTFLYSFTTVNARGDIIAFAGLDNFTYLFSRREFRASLDNTLRLTLLNVPVTLLLTLGMALLCVKKRRLSPVYETMFMLPMAVAMSAITLIFKVMLNPTVGIVNYALGLDWGWFRDRNTAFYGILALDVWMGLGFNFLLLLAALRAVPDAMLESARLDGAGQLQLLLHIQLPTILPTILYVICTNTVQAMLTSGPVMILTQGGPARSTTTLIYMMYSSGYSSANFSLASCVSLVTFGLTLLFTVVTVTMDERKGRDA